jgi:Flp pilus assembly protein TadG
MIIGRTAGFATAARHWYARSIARRFIRQRDGATAVEFGLVAVPFLAVMFAIIQSAMTFFASQALRTAASYGGRLIMTGQAQAQGFDAAKFKNAVCANINGAFNCQASVYVDVKTYTGFSSVNNNALPVDQNGNLQTGNFAYQPGGPNDIVVVRLMYQMPMQVTLLGLNMSNMAGGNRLVMSTVAFRNEMYQ